MRILKHTGLAAIAAILIIASTMNSSCGIYRFRDVSIPDTIHTVKINYIENKAPYVNPQLSPRLTEKLKQKIVGQTKLSQTNGDNADWEISCTVRDYALSTSAISGQREATNRLTVSIHVTIYKRKGDETKEYDVSRNFEFSATQSLQQAEASLNDEMIRSLTDEIFNRIFSEW